MQNNFDRSIGGTMKKVKELLGKVKTLDKKKKKQLIHKLYTAPLWKPAGDPRFYKKTTKNRRLKALLYRYKLLFLFFKIKSLVKK